MRTLSGITLAHGRFLLRAGALLATIASGATVLSEDLPPGLVAERPASGRFVKIDRGYMVPYSQVIPGTNVSFQMEPVPGGRFFLGSPDSEEGQNPDERPRVEVQISPFWIGAHEVTWGEYRIYMSLCSIFEEFDDRQIRQVTKENHTDAITAPSKLYDPTFTFSSGEDPRQPAVSMSQYAAKQYTKWLSLLTGDFYRLPTECEWEYMCRAGSSRSYCFGESTDQLGDYAWYSDNANDKTHKVGLKTSNAWGIYDTHGNASEWVLDAYDPNWYGKLHQQETGVTGETAVNWPTKLFPRVLRGGSAFVGPAQCRSASRQPSDDDQLRIHDPNVPKSPWWLASEEARGIGMRILRPLDPPPPGERPRYWDADVRAIRRAVNSRIFQEGRGKQGLVNPTLPEAIDSLKK